MIVEKNMEKPILQVAAGRFTKHHNGLTLAVLSTRDISILSIESKNNFSTVNLLQNHKLDRNAFNFIHGQFGNTQHSNHQIIVQSVDGALIVIDDEFIIFKISLADYFIPGPI